MRGQSGQGMGFIDRKRDVSFAKNLFDFQHPFRESGTCHGWGIGVGKASGEPAEKSFAKIGIFDFLDFFPECVGKICKIFARRSPPLLG